MSKYIVEIHCRNILSKYIVEIYCRSILSKYIFEIYCRNILSNYIAEIYCRNILQSINKLSDNKDNERDYKRKNLLMKGAITILLHLIRLKSLSNNGRYFVKDVRGLRKKNPDYKDPGPASCLNHTNIHKKHTSIPNYKLT